MYPDTNDDEPCDRGFVGDTRHRALILALMLIAGNPIVNGAPASPWRVIVGAEETRPVGLSDAALQAIATQVGNGQFVVVDFRPALPVHGATIRMLSVFPSRGALERMEPCARFLIPPDGLAVPIDRKNPMPELAVAWQKLAPATKNSDLPDFHALYGRVLSPGALQAVARGSTEELKVGEWKIEQAPLWQPTKRYQLHLAFAALRHDARLNYDLGVQLLADPNPGAQARGLQLVQTAAEQGYEDAIKFLAVRSTQPERNAVDRERARMER